MSDYDPERQTDRRDPSVKTRETDDTSEAKDFIRQRKAYRRWTVFYATLSAGFIALFFNGLYDNGAARRSQKVCDLTQAGDMQNYISAQVIVDETDDPDARRRQTDSRDAYALIVPKTKKTPLGTAKTCKQQFPTKQFIIF